MNDKEYKLLWDEAYNQLKNEFINQGKQEEFEIWFNMDFAKANDKNFCVFVPSDFMWDRIKSIGIKKAMEDKLSEICGSKIYIDSYQIKSNINQNIKITEQTISPSEKTSQNNSNLLSQTIKTSKKHPDLDPNFTFESFVPSENTNFAYNVALAVSKNPGNAYNPILIYGGVGLGKTHLMEAIGNKIYSERGDSLKICYITAENFANKFTESIANKKMNEFKAKYRKVDVLLMDDIHFLIGKPQTQEELFNTFESLKQHKSQMVFTCDRPIHELPSIEERLKSRFFSGICVDLQPPSYETRCAIIQRKLALKKKTLSPQIIDYIAKNVQTNVRDLEAYLKTTLAYIEFSEEEVPLEEIEEHIFRKNPSSSNSKPIKINTIQKVVADYYGISLSDLTGKKRNSKISNARHVAVYLSRTLTEYSLPEIGCEFGGRDHTTIMHSNTKIEDALKTDSQLNYTIEKLIENIKNYKK